MPETDQLPDLCQTSRSLNSLRIREAGWWGSRSVRGATPQSGTRNGPAAEILYPTLLCGQEDIFRAKKIACRSDPVALSNWCAEERAQPRHDDPKSAVIYSKTPPPTFSGGACGTWPGGAKTSGGLR